MANDFLFDPDSNALDRLDYRPPEYLIDETDLHFDLHETETRVKSKLTVRRNPDAPEGGPLMLNGEDLKLVSVKLDGKDLDRGDFEVTDKHLIIKRPPEQPFTLEIENEINPKENTMLSGLYIPEQEEIFCTQCEAQGFRRITYYLDRPDVLSTFHVTVEADKEKYPLLMSNGNGDPTKTTDLGNGRHEISWDDPHKKPAYLFALVAGDLPYIEDKFVTRSGREVELRIFAPEGYEDKIDWAMESIKKSMKWDEDTYDREYDLDVFHIVATTSFNAGAMENKGLNIFNISLLAGDAETATDDRLIAIEAVIGHEYFHNWSGDRVTLRDWFELTLKEGLTVLRDRQFTADMHSQAIKDIEDATDLKARQFIEDAGPTAHPIRPDHVAEFDNIYTGTIYEKGSHVLGMMRTLLGTETWREAMNEYFDRFDGQAVTCDDFVDVMQEVSGLDLSHFRKWYSQAGTPELSYSGEYDAASKTYRLTLEQETKPTSEQAEKEALYMPISVGLIGQDGKDIPLSLKGDTEAGPTTRVLHLKKDKQVFEFTNVEGPVVPSILRGFSAPVKVMTKASEDELVFRMKHDSDGYNRFDAAQEYMAKVVLDMAKDIEAGKEAKAPAKLLNAVGHVLSTDAKSGDKAFVAKMLELPSYSILVQSLEVVNPDALLDAADKLKEQILDAHQGDLATIYQATITPPGDKYEVTPKQVGRRALHNLTLDYLAADKSDEAAKIAKLQYDQATNMTERLGALTALSELDKPETQAALDNFYDRYKSNTNIVDSWLGVQARMDGGDGLERVKKLTEHEAFSWKVPNKVRSLVGAFAAGNPRHFHRKDGEGYKFLADAVIKLNTINPRVGAGLVKPLLEFKRYDKDRQELMLEQLDRVKATPKLDKGIRELVDKALATRDGATKKGNEPKPSGGTLAA
ncbi:MAG: aminopeptidase N [Alphaproteobacteria bacterium]|nr:MAG: aminopeptidase N [Alphaproteobacteria bacterium]